MSQMNEIEVARSSSRVLTARVSGSGDFTFSGHEVMESQDIGDPSGRYAGDLDYERTVAAEFKDAMLLWLVKERFGTDTEFDDWLDAKGIPSEFQNVV